MHIFFREVGFKTFSILNSRKNTKKEGLVMLCFCFKMNFIACGHICARFL